MSTKVGVYEDEIPRQGREYEKPDQEGSIQ